jgi:hypothetical protein
MVILGIDMRSALILSGAFRNIEDTYDSIKYHILDKFQGIDVFFYGCENINGFEQNIKFLKDNFDIKSYVVNQSIFYTSGLGSDTLSSIKVPNGQMRYWDRSIWAFYNVMMCNELKKRYELQNGFRYDFVIRSRMDLFWFRGITDEEIELSVNNIVIPWDWAFRSGPPWNGPNPFGFADLYAFSNNELFDFYADAYKFIPEFSESYIYHPESLLGYYLKNISVKEVPRHVITEYPIKQRLGFDSNGDPLPEPFHHPKIWDGDVDFGSNNIHHIGGLRVKLDCDRY